MIKIFVEFNQCWFSKVEQKLYQEVKFSVNPAAQIIMTLNLLLVGGILQAGPAGKPSSQSKKKELKHNIPNYPNEALKN